MSAQLNARINRPSTSRSSYSQPTFETRKLGKEKLSLLRAPSIDAAAMWKQQCFQSVYNRLRGKLSPTCNADALIAVFNEHFPLSTLPAEDIARRAVRDFRLSFS